MASSGENRAPQSSSTTFFSQNLFKSASMNGMHRLLTRRDKDKTEKNNSQQRSKSTDASREVRPKSGDSILAIFRYPYDDKKADKEEAKKVQRILNRLRDLEYRNFDEPQVEFGLRTEYAAGNEERAFELLVLIRDSIDGIVLPYDPEVHMLGAKNLGGVTCYLDTLLFAMFARSDAFLPIIQTTFEDEPRTRLATLIRIWINMLRTGKLIHCDITKYMQEAIAACGWKEASEKRQQDASEAFGFITEQLQLPLLTLKTDLFHIGQEDTTGDHKFVNERLLDVAVLPDREDGRTIKLEDCLEEYFNNRVEVRRNLIRSNTQSSMPGTRRTQSEKPNLLSQLRVSELSGSGSSTPEWQECASPSLPPPTPTIVDIAEDDTMPSTPKFRPRTSSIIKRRFSFDDRVTEMEFEKETGDVSRESLIQLRKSARSRKEVQLPAWAITRMMPFTTGPNFITPTTDAQVASHFSSMRPMLGICLKRYAVLENGETVRRDTMVDIPLQIAIPHFIQQEDESMFANFKISLQSVICHRGTSVHSGHYISLIRGPRKPDVQSKTLERQLSQSSSPPEYSEDPWFKFDDLAAQRVTQVDIHEALKNEMPYLLFYQIQPLLEETLPEITEEKPPSYTDSGIEMAFQGASPREEGSRRQSNQEPGYFDNTAQLHPTSNRISFTDDVEQHRRSLNLPDAVGTYSRRGSVAITEASLGSRTPSIIASATTTPGDENPTIAAKKGGPGDDENTTASRLSRAASKFRGQHSRSTSAAGESRMSFSFLRKKSKDELSLPNDKPKQSSDRPASVVTLGTDGMPEDMADDQDTADDQADGVYLTRKRSKKGKGKDKSKTLPEKNKNNRSTNGLSKAMFSDKDGNDRECIIM